MVVFLIMILVNFSLPQCKLLKSAAETCLTVTQKCYPNLRLVIPIPIPFLTSKLLHKPKRPHIACKSGGHFWVASIRTQKKVQTQHRFDVKRNQTQ